MNKMNAIYRNLKSALLFAIVVIGLGLSTSSCRQSKHSTTTEIQKIAINLRANPDKLNPFMTTSSYSGIINNQLFPSLLTINPKTLKYEPWLAVDLPTRIMIDTGRLKGNQAFQYEIRPEAVWDDGSPVTGLDYLTTMKIINIKSVDAPVYRSYLGSIEEVQVDKDNPKRFTVLTNNDYFKAHEMTGLPILPAYHYDSLGVLQTFDLKDIKNKEYYEEHIKDHEWIATLAKRINSPRMTRQAAGVKGCGAYELVEWKTDQYLFLKKKENWWGDQLAEKNILFSAVADELRYEITTDQNTAYNKLREGYVDIINSIDPNIFEEAKKDESNVGKLNFFTPKAAKYYYFGFNTLDPKLASPELRNALAHLVDYDKMIHLLFSDAAERLNGPILPNKDYYNKDIVAIPFDIEKAKILLDELGWIDTDQNGSRDKIIDGIKTELDFSVLVSSGSIVLKDAINIWAEGAKEAGVNIKMIPQEFGTLRKNLKKKNFEVFALAAGLDLGMDDLYQQWHSASITTGGNRSGFSSEESDQIIETIRSNVSEDTRTEAYLRIQEILHEEQAFIFLFTPLERIIMSSDIKDAFVSPKYPGYFENYYHCIVDEEG